MGKFIHLFNTEAEYEAKRESGYTEPWVSYTRETSAVTYNKDEHEELLEMPLTFEILGNGNISWKVDGDEVPVAGEKTIEFKKNNGAWSSITSTEEGVNIPVSNGDTIQFRGNNASYSYDFDDYGCYSHFDSSCQFKVKGNIMSLIDSTGFATANTLTDDHNFIDFFESSTGLTDASKLVLPATSLTESCYSSMFWGCTNLASAPELPATELVYSCYSSMFDGCSSLTSAPALPATTLASSCYQNMFYGCTNLATVPELPATTLASNCYESMFEECTSLTSAPALPATTLANYCYRAMFRNCSSLEVAPVLSTTTLVDNCYENMFYECSNLNYIKCLATDISAEDCTLDWVSIVSSTGTFVKNANMSSWLTGDSGIPNGWTIQNA